RRTRRAYRFRRPARDRTDDPRKTAGRVSARRISARSRHGRYGHASPRHAGHAFAPCPYPDEETQAQIAPARTNRHRHGAARARMSVAAQSDLILQRLLSLHPKKIDLVLDRILRLLADLGHPELRLPPTLHVAGTNGKGSTCAFARAMLEAQGLKVHVYTSPHLVHFNERIRIAGRLITEDELSATLEECE